MSQTNPSDRRSAPLNGRMVAVAVLVLLIGSVALAIAFFYRRVNAGPPAPEHKHSAYRISTWA